MTHTPAPWWSMTEGFRSYIMYHDAEYDRDLPVTSLGLPSLDANLKLMAAAPDLLEACLAYVEAYDADTGTVHVNKQMRAAIAKARGETQ